MARKLILTLFLASIVMFLLQFLPGGSQPKQDRQPLNFLWITTEDLSPRLRPFGDPTASTPNIDGLAARGVRFTRVYSVAGVCAPSRAALITGMYPTSIGAQHMRTLSRTAALEKVTDPEALAIPVYEAVPPPEVRCFPEYLRAAGYFCTNNSKTDYQFRPPLTAWDENGKDAHWRNRPAGMPFFSVFNITTTHESQVWERSKDPLDIDPASVTVPPYYPDTPLIRRDIARHYNNIQIMDGQVGEILDQLVEDGLSGSTVVFFFSDHGDGLPRAKRWLYDSGLHVPLIVRFPDGRQAGSTAEELISFVDFAPTMLSLAGIPVPRHLQGQAFLGDQKAPARKYVYASKDRMDPAIDTARAVRDTRFKYIRNYRPERPFVQFIPYRDQMALMQELLRLHSEGRLDPVQSLWFRSEKPVEELYDTWNDPHEIRNLAGNPSVQEKLSELRRMEERRVKDTGDPLALPESELVRRMWPPDGTQPHTAPPVFHPQGGRFRQSLEVEIRCETEGASVAYRIDDSRWMLYTGPIRLTGTARIQSRAHRIGFQPSPERSALFEKD